MENKIKKMTLSPTTYILFLFGSFEDHEDVEFFCNEIFSKSTFLSIKYVIENDKNIIIIFDSLRDKNDIIIELFEIIPHDNIRFYFFFERESIITAYVPEKMKDFMFKFETDGKIDEYEFFKKEEEEELDLDIILDKIKVYGMDSLTNSEKNFLKNFE